jgi:hypothetical protein
MTEKFNKYLECECCKKLENLGYGQVFKNIIQDDENFVSEEMKLEFFKHLEKYDGTTDIFHFCDSFFDEPQGVRLSEKKYLFKGKSVDDRIYKIELGRVVSTYSFRRSLNNAILNQSLTFSIAPITDIADETLLDSLTIENKVNTSISENLFKEFISDTGIGEQKVQEHPMWTFEGLDNDDAFYGIDMADLPCLLGLPGQKRTDEEYDKIPRVAFSLSVAPEILVYKPTSFDAGLMTVWRCGGKTKCHSQCEEKYGDTGMEEYVHEPINFDSITSNIYKL